MMSPLANEPGGSRGAAPRAAERPFRIVVAGEFNSGKSSLINLLFRDHVLPASVGSSGAPVTNIHPGDETRYTALRRDGREIDAEAYFAGVQPGSELSSVNVEVPFDALRGCVVTEVSLGLDDGREVEHMAALREADLLIWCTMAQRAWSLTEIDIVRTLPRQSLNGAILAVTRSDYLVDDRARGLVQERLDRHAREYFHHIHMVDCSRRRVDGAAEDDRVWRMAGGQKILSLVMEHLGRPMPDMETARAGAARQPSRTAHANGGMTRSRPSQLFESWSEMVDEIGNWLERKENARAGQVIDYIHGQMKEFLFMTRQQLPANALESHAVNQIQTGVALMNYLNRADSLDDMAAFFTDLCLQVEEYYAR